MRQRFKNILHILNAPEQRKFLGLILLDIFTSLLDIIFLALLLYVIQYYTSATADRYIPLFLAPLFHQYPLLPIALFFAFFSLKNIFNYLVFHRQSRFFYAVASRLSKRNMQHYFDAEYPAFINIDSSVHNRRISQQPIEFGYYILGGMHQVISQAVLIVITVTAILLYNPVLFPLLLAVLTPPVCIAGWLMKRKLGKIRKRARVVSEKAIQYLNEGLAGFIEADLYDCKDFLTGRYGRFQQEFNTFLADQQVVQNMPSRLMEAFAVFGLFILIFVTHYLSPRGTVPVITLGAFMAAAYKIIPGIVKLLNSVGQIRTYDFVIVQLLEKPKKIPLSVVKNNQPISSIVFDHISFNYNDHAVLAQCSFNIKPGDFIGISGISGSGKTTLINILLGFLKPTGGKLLVNGTPVNGEESYPYRRNIAYVKQQPFLVHDTIRQNILLGEEKENVEDLERAVSMAGLLEFVGSFPDGLDKIITDQGRNISGGQRQRILIARALYKNADLIILDEPFNELDRASEHSILDQLAALAKDGKMIILVTHQVDSFSFCNKIISVNGC